MALWYDEFDWIHEHDFEQAHPYDDDIETTIYAWERLAKSYNEEVRKLSWDLYEQLSKIRCKKVLTDQMTRLSKTDFHYHDFYKHFRRKRFQRLQRNFDVSNRQTIQKKNF